MVVVALALQPTEVEHVCEEQDDVVASLHSETNNLAVHSCVQMEAVIVLQPSSSSSSSSSSSPLSLPSVSPTVSPGSIFGSAASAAPPARAATIAPALTVEVVDAAVMVVAWEWSTVHRSEYKLTLYHSQL